MLCDGLDGLIAPLAEGAGAVLLAEDAIDGRGLTGLLDLIHHQPAWSDLPFLLLLRPGGSTERPTREHHMLQASGNLTVLERPIGTVTLVSAVRAALRARLRQYEVADGFTALAESEAQTRILIDALPQLVWTCLPDGRCDYLSRQFLAFIGRPLCPLPGQPCLEPIVHPDDQSASRAAWAAVAAGAAEYDLEHRLRRGDGVYCWFKTRARPMRDAAGAITRWFGTCTDIGDIVRARETLARSRLELEQQVAERTRSLAEANRRLTAEIAERERAQAALREAHKLEAVGQLTSGVAHDFNNLLTAVAGNLEMAQRRVQDARVERLLRAASRAAERGAQLTQHLLAFSRKQHLAPRPVCLNELVRAAMPLLARTIGYSVKFETVLDDALWVALVDPTQIELVLVSLAANARDAMPQGGELIIRTANVPAPERPSALAEGDYVVLAVRDTGTGMTEEVLSRARDPFFTTKPIGQGSGLGLSMAHGVAIQSGGRLRIETVVGAGTTVSVYLPRANG